jgi:hypothetical protein
VSREVRYHPKAAAELVEAEAWYEQQRRGLGDRFMAASEVARKRINRWPNTGTPVLLDGDGTVVNRKTPIGGFPWAVGYEVIDGAVIVLAVFHQHRLPDYWTSRQR